jgi:HEAT repeat protein
MELDALGQLLEHLGDTGHAVSMTQLYHLSDLSGEQLAAFCSAWDAYETPRRRRLAHALVDLAEANFEVNFDALFIHFLEDPDGEVRATAIDGLWENQELGLIGPFLTMLRSDPSARVRASAATGLGRYVLAGELDRIEGPVHERITTELLTVLHLADESIEVRRRAVESVAYACTPETMEAVETAYYDDDEDMRISAVVGMGRSCDKRWKDLLLQELNSSSPAMRYEAAWACGELTLRQAVPVLVRLLDDPDRQVCNATIWALGQIGGPQAKQALIDAYEDADEDTQVALDEALAEHALSEGELDFALYDLGSDEDEELFGDEFINLWTISDADDDSQEEDGSL